MALTIICGVVAVCWLQPDYGLSLCGLINEIASWLLFAGLSVVLFKTCVDVGVWEQFRLRRGGLIGDQHEYGDLRSNPGIIGRERQKAE
jgi:hypothetical protein